MSIKKGGEVRLVEKTSKVDVFEIGRVSWVSKGLAQVNFKSSMVTATLEELICTGCDRPHEQTPPHKKT